MNINSIACPKETLCQITYNKYIVQKDVLFGKLQQLVNTKSLCIEINVAG